MNMGIGMQIELTESDISTIEDWYNAASQESAVDRSEALFALLDRLHIHATGKDLYFPNAEHLEGENRQCVLDQIAAIKAYRRRHPDYEEVQEAERWQPND